MAWYDSEELDEDDVRLMQTAHHNVFYATEEGRQVLFNLRRMCYGGGETPAETVALIALYERIRANAGIDNMETIEIEARIANAGRD
jgi:hypothetical protein